MAAPIPSFFKIRCWLVVIAFLLFFMFLGMVKNVFSQEGCPYNLSPYTDCQITQHCNYPTADAAHEACGVDCVDRISLSNGYSAGMPSGTTFYRDADFGSPCVFSVYYFCSDCSDCTEERASASSQCGGDDQYTINIETCEWTCTNCIEERSQASQECGGDDQYTINIETCEWDCNSDPGDSDGDGLPDDEDPCPANPDPNCVNPCSEDNPDCDSDGDGLPDDTDPCWDNPDLNCTNPCPEDDPDCDANGNGIPDVDEIPDYLSDEPPYGTDDDFGLLFGERWNQFTGEIKDTSFFSIPSQLTGDIGSGSEESSIIIEGGETLGGTHEISFSNWIPGLAVLRGVLYFAACFIAVRIVTLKY